MTIETTSSQVREQLESFMDRAIEDREVIMVRRRGGDAVAIIAADELDGLMETAHLLRSPRNAERLLTALARARGDSIAPLSVTDLRRVVGCED